MQSTRIQIGDIKVSLRKKPFEPVVFAKIGGERVEISIENNQIEVLSGEVPTTILDKLKERVAQYFLPLQKNNKKNNPL